MFVAETLEVRLRGRRSWVLVIGAAIAALGVTWLPLGPFTVFELETLDLRFRLRERWAARPEPATLAVVALDDRSLAAHDRDPMPLAAYAAAAETLAARGAAPIGLDLVLNPLDDRLLAFASAGGALVRGVARIDRDEDGVARWLPLFDDASGTREPTLVTRMAAASLGVPVREVRFEAGGVLDFAGRRRIPIDDQGRMLINYRRSDRWEVIPLVDVVAGSLPAATPWAGRPVLLGPTARQLGRSHSTPIEREAAEVEVLAAGVETILQGRFLRPVSRATQFLVNWLVFLLAAVFITRVPPLRGVAIGIGLMLLYFVFEKAAFIWGGVWLDVIGPMCALQAATLGLPLYAYTRRTRNLLSTMSRVRRFDDLILSSTTSALLVADARGRIDRANVRAAQLLGYNDGALEGRDLDAIFASSPVALAAIDQVRGPHGKSRTPVYDETVHVAALLESPAGDRWLDLSVAALEGDPDVGGNDERRLLLTFTDITERLRVAQDDERRARLAAVGEIAARLGHEIRNSLGGLRLYVENVREEIDPKGAAGRAIDSMVDEIESLYRKIDELREYARDPSIEPTECDLAQLVDEALAFAGQKLRAKQIQVRVDSEPHLPAVRCDRRQIRDAFQNIINNAIEAAPDGGHLHVTVERSTNGLAPAGWTVIHFDDDGPGIPSEIGEQVFSLFFTTKPEAGTGLGLPIVKKIVESHGGKIGFRSDAGAGTRFTIVLPPRQRDNTTADCGGTT